MTNDLGVAAYVSRDYLDDDPLDINDHSVYVIAGPHPIQGAVQWSKRQVEAPWVDGQITVERHRQNSVDSLTIYVAGTSMADLEANIGTLKDAFFQDRFTLQLIVGGANHAWDCEAADITQVLYDTAHVYNKYVAITFAVPRKPIPLAGSI